MKNHYYVSIPVYAHEVFKYAGEVPLGMEYDYTEAFKRFGLTGLPGPDERDGPYDVLVLPSYKGEQINKMGEKFPEDYVPKQIMLTKRVPCRPLVTGGIVRRLWTKKSCRDSEDAAVQHASKNGWMLHYFDVDEEIAWIKAVERHKDIEVTLDKLTDKLETR